MKVMLAAIMGTQGAINGVYLPFFPLWLAHRGFDAAEIAALLTAPMVARIVFTPVLATIADLRVHPARLLFIMSLAVAAGYGAMLLTEDRLVVAAVFVAIAFAQAPGLPFGDLLIIGAGRANPRLNFGRTRMWASIAFLAANLGIGALVGMAGAGIIGPALAVAGLLAVLAVAVHPGVGLGRPDHGDSAPRRGGMPRPVVILTLAASTFIQGSHALLYAFGSLIWRDAGWSGPAIGGLWALGVVAEILLFALAGHLVRSVRAGAFLLIIGGVIATLRFTAMATEPGTAATILLQTLHAGSFCATYLGTIALLTAFSTAGERARMQGWLSASNAALMAVATLASGPAYRAFGFGAYGGMAVLAVAGTVLALAAAFVAARRTRAENP